MNTSPTSNFQSPISNLLSRITHHASRLTFLLWSLTLLFPHLLQPNSVAMPPQSQFSDLLISHLPNAIFANRSFLYFHQFPLWNPLLLSGAPFAADPLSGLWYPPNWITILFPYPITFNILFALHLAWAGWGMYRWARDDGFDVLPSLMGGLIFAGMPKLIAHLGAGHVSLVFAISWTPFLLHTVSRQSPHFAPNRQLLITIYLSLIFFADIRWFVYAFALALILFFITTPHNKYFLYLLSFLLFLLITSISWLPLLEFIQHSSRVSLTPDEAGALALPLSSLIGFIIPNLGGVHEWQTYPGVAPLALAIIGVITTRSNLQSRISILLIFFSLWFALGTKAGLFTLIANIPFASLLRIPSRAIFVVGIVVAWLAVRGAQSLKTSSRISTPHLTGLAEFNARQIVNRPVRCGRRAWNLVSLAVAASLWILAIGGSIVSQKPIISFIGAAIIITSTLIVLRFKRPLNYLLLITVLELLWVNLSLYEVRPIQLSPVAEWLSQREGVWRVYSPSYSLPQNEAARFNLQQADGVNPMQIADVSRYMQQATGVTCKGYSVTVPCFDDDVNKANINAAPNAKLLGDLNVRYIVSEFDLRGDGFVKRDQIGSTRIYENTFDMGRMRGGKIISWTPNRIVIASDGADNVETTPQVVVETTRWVVLSEIWYPGWAAWVDGVPVEVERDGIFRAVTVNANAREIIFEFRPMSVYIGATLSFIGLLIIVFLFIRHAS
ncbi:MAG: hypothetical protein HZB77_15545 [Chloroflexi bacterium]|nr:hypothetical protein [Chloroflexota bacterium]